MLQYLENVKNALLNAGNSVKFLFLLLMAFLIRFPFFFRDYIDRDESTFILMGQSLVDGHLPYTELWDLKPPLVYFILAGLIGVFGKSFIAIRLFAVLLVASTGYFTYRIANRISGHGWAFAAGILSVYLVSLFGSLQGLMSEHISTFFFILGLWMVLRNTSPGHLFLAGLVFGLAVMTKTNLAYALLLLLVFLFFAIPKVPWQQRMYKTIATGLGILVVVGFTYLPYALQDRGEFWLNAVYFAPMAYADLNMDSILKVIPLGLVLGLFLWIAYRFRSLDFSNHEVRLVLLVLAGIVFSFFRIGKVNGHYLIQIYPLMLILLSAAISTRIPSLPKWTGPAGLALLLLMPMETYKESIDLARHARNEGTLYNGEGISVPTYLKANNLNNRPVLFLEYHIGYWLIDQKPPTKAATHPSNICRAEMFPYYNEQRKSGLEEIRFIMEEKKPEIVVIRSEKSIFDKANEEENAFINSYLDAHYSVLTQIDRALILKRSKRP